MAEAAKRGRSRTRGNKAKKTKASDRPKERKLLGESQVHTEAIAVFLGCFGLLGLSDKLTRQDWTVIGGNRGRGSPMGPQGSRDNKRPPFAADGGCAAAVVAAVIRRNLPPRNRGRYYSGSGLWVTPFAKVFTLIPWP